MDELLKIIAKAPSWLIILVVFAFVIEPLTKAFRKRKSKQEITYDGQISFNRNSNQMFPRKNTLLPMDPASLYRDTDVKTSKYDNFNEEDDEYKRK